MQTVTSSQDRATNFPAYFYRATNPPKVVKDADEAKSLGPGWGRFYVHQDHPRAMYAPNGQKRIAADLADEQRLHAQGFERTPPDGYIEPTQKTAEDLRRENEALKAQMMEIENDKMRVQLAEHETRKAAEAERHATKQAAQNKSAKPAEGGGSQ